MNNYIRIAKWEKFQHYTKRNPPWVKLYSAFLDDDDFDCMPDASKLLFFCLLSFASRKNNQIKADFIWLQKKLPIKKKITKETLQPLINAGFIECYQDDSVVLADRTQDATPETETETETETEKNKYMEFVFLTNEEYAKLIERFGEQETQEKIEILNNYIGSKGKKYKSHYHTILAWERRNGRTGENQQHKTKLFPIAGKTCGAQGCNLPAVYKNTKGQFDHFRCINHAPKEVKESYC